GAAALGAAALGSAASWPALAQRPAITAIIPSVFLPDAARPILESVSGVKVENAPYVSPTDTIAKLMAPGGTSRYDFMASNTAFAIGPVLGEKAGDERGRPINMANVPNAKDIMPLFQKEIIKRGDKVYLVPIFWGYDTCIFNKDKVPENDPLTQSWGLVFGDKYAGKVSIRDDAHASIIPTSLHMGVKDPFKMDKKDLEEVTKFLISLKKKNHFRTLWANFTEAINLMASGEVVAESGFISMRPVLQKQGIKVGSNFPREGTIFWGYSAWIPRDSPNYASSEKVINAFISKEYGVKLTEVTQYPSTNAKALAEFSKETQKEYGFDVTEKGVRLISYEMPKNLDEWIEAWAKFKAA
ncbi:MAG: extracellular solute-binding protein, partial [Proteobacteria bacterium]|nr:extracellular solute-binding protein [Pseudomonadota bacterium]